MLAIKLKMRGGITHGPTYVLAPERLSVLNSRGGRPLCAETAMRPQWMFAHLHNCDDGITLGRGMITFPGYLVSRAVLQFEYSKFLLGKETRKLNTSLLHQTFDKYFDNSSKTWPQSIANGESGTIFLAGIFLPEDDSGVGAD